MRRKQPSNLASSPEVLAALEELKDDVARRGRRITLIDVDKACERHELDALEAALLGAIADREGLLADEAWEGGEESVPTDPRRHALLTAKEEAALARAIEGGKDAEASLVDSDMPHHLREELVKKARRGRAARDRFVLANVRLVAAMARRYAGHALDEDDLVQEGVIGLMTAVEKFDWRRGLKFSTYATWWIRQTIDRAVMDRGDLIRLPVHVHESIRQLRKVERSLAQQLGRPATDEEVTDTLGIAPSRLAFLRDVAAMPVSLDAPVGADTDGFTLADTIGSRTTGPEEQVTASDLQDYVLRMLERLSARQREVIHRRYGIGTDAPETLESIGQSWDVTRERIRQIQVKAEQRLRMLLGVISDEPEDPAS